MKKTLLALLIVAGVTFTSCDGNKQAYTINGTVPATVEDSTLVYFKIVDIDFKGELSKDSTYVVAGKFAFAGVADSLQRMGSVSLANAPYAVSIVVEPGQIAVGLDSVSTVSGTVANDASFTFGTKQQSFNKTVTELKAQIKELGGPDTDAAKAIISEFEPKSNAFDAEWKEYVKANIAKQEAVSYLLMRSYMFDLDEKVAMLDAMPTAFKESKGIQKLMANVEALKLTAVGTQFTDVSGKNLAGVDVSLSNYVGKNKYVLVDFWASWCPPCRRDMPHVVDAYKKYKSKGLEIVGISLDDKQEAWAKGMKELNVTWPQISDLKGWGSELSKVYGVNSIPHTLIIDAEGKIIARGLNSEETMAKLDELFK